MRQLFPRNTFVQLQLGSSTRLAIAESPGEDESIQGFPMVGSAGKWLEGLYRKAGVKKDEVTIVNCIQCRPPENVFPTDLDARSYISEVDAKKAVEHCVNVHVKPVLAGRAWTRVDILGDKALRFVAGKTEGIFTWRGSPISIAALGHSKPIAIPTLHPSYLARDQAMIPVVISDLKKNAGTLPPENYDLAPSLEVVQNFTATEFAFDLETMWGTQEIKIVGLCAKLGHAIAVPFLGAYKPELRRIFANAKILYAHHGLQFDIPILFKELNLTWEHRSL